MQLVIASLNIRSPTVLERAPKEELKRERSLFAQHYPEINPFFTLNSCRERLLAGYDGIILNCCTEKVTRVHDHNKLSWMT